MDIDLDSIGKTKLLMIAQLVQSLPMHNYLETTLSWLLIFHFSFTHLMLDKVM